MKTVVDINNFYEPSNSATIKQLLRRTLVQQQVYSAFISRNDVRILKHKTQIDRRNIFYDFIPLRCCVKSFVALCVFVSTWINFLDAQQNTENLYRKPLKEVLNDIQKRYGVQIKYDEKLVADKFVNYADWRYRTDVEVTLDNVLSPLDMIAKKEKDKVYKLSNYEYYRWQP
ncbi:MAG TPA: hypothetical protein VFZ33_13530, partial [Chitinophagaceae bacterium]